MASTSAASAPEAALPGFAHLRALAGVWDVISNYPPDSFSEVAVFDPAHADALPIQPTIRCAPGGGSTSAAIRGRRAPGPGAWRISARAGVESGVPGTCDAAMPLRPGARRRLARPPAFSIDTFDQGGRRCLWPPARPLINDGCSGGRRFPRLVGPRPFLACRMAESACPYG